MNPERRFENFSQFYPFYLSEHANLWCRRFHFVGSLLNESQASVTFDVETDTALTIRNVYNYPDPFSSGTAFTFQRSDAGGAGEPVNVTIKVFTISGRLIKTIKAYGITDTFVKIDWNGLDDEGDRLANGVYLYTVTARTIDGKYTSEALGKMAVLR